MRRKKKKRKSIDIVVTVPWRVKNKEGEKKNDNSGESNTGE